MKEIALQEAVRLIFPRTTVVVTSIDNYGKVNAAPYSWISPVSFEPPMIYLGIQKKRTRTIKNIQQTKEFAVHVVTRDWAQQALECEAKGAEDKLLHANLETTESKKISVPRIKKAKIVLECKLAEIVEVQGADHYLVVGEIVHAEQDPSVKNSEILMHLLGEKFIFPGEEISLERKK